MHSLPMLSLLFAALMIVLTKAPVAMAMSRERGGYDNRHPRAQQARLEGFGARALASHQNMLEAFPVFAAGLLAALWAGADTTVVATLAVIFCIARVAYTVFYLIDLHAMRSITWSAGFLASIGLMVVAVP